MPSLADQLANNAPLNSAFLVERSKRKSTVSYLFTGRDADQYDLETIFALGQNAFIQLCSVELALETFENVFFSDMAKATDRTLLARDAVEELDKSITVFLGLLGPYLMDAPTGMVIEWLVRRFRINDFNPDAVMALFLPYHETPHFTKMVSILNIKPNTLWSFLVPYKSAAQNIQRVSLVSEMLRNTDLARFVASLLPNALKAGQGHVHRTLLAFNAATINEFIKRSKRMNEGTGVLLATALLEPLHVKGREASKEAILGSYVLLATLSLKCDLASPVLKTIVGAMAGVAQYVSTDQFVSAIFAVCQGQKELDKVSESTVKAILRLPGINEEMTVACQWLGSEKLLVPLVSRLVPKLSEIDASEFVENIIISASVSELVLLHLTKFLTKAILTAETTLKERQLLSILHQRHPQVIQQVSQEIITEDEDAKDSVEELIISLSMTQAMPSGSKSQSFDLIVSSAHADANVRAIAVRKLLSSLPEGADSDDFITIQGALLGRVHDFNVQVLEALYETPENLARVVVSNPSEYINTLAASIAAPSSKLKRAALRLHLGFLISHILCLLDVENQEAVFKRLLLPFLLFSKPRQHTVELVWESVGQVLKAYPALLALELLKGCPTVVKRGKDSERTVEMMVNTNLAITLTVAENILSSNHTAKYLEMLTTTLQDENPHSRSFAFLTMRSLLQKMSGALQVEVAHKALDALKLEQLPAVNDLTEQRDLLEAVGPETIGKLVVVKPTSRSTLSWLQVGLVSAISMVPQSPNLQINWLKDSCALPHETDDLYISSARKVYSLLNNSGNLPVLALGILQNLFTSLGNDVLAFLAGIWVSTMPDLQRLQTLALLQAMAFLEAHVQETDEIDFQTIIPALLVALQGSNTQSRLAALECIKRLRIISGTKFTQVYKFDAIYGADSQDLQYLDQSDLQRFLEALLAHSDHFENDRVYLAAFHGHHLAKQSGDKKKYAQYKRRVLCFLLSHINSLSSASMQITLLRSIGPVSDKVKLQLLLPTVQRLLLPDQHQPEDLRLELLRSFNESTSKDLNDATTPFWKVYIALLRHHLRPDQPEASRKAIAESLEQGLYAKLDASRQVELCRTLFELCSDDPSLQRFCKQLLTDLLNEVPVIVSLLDSHLPSNSAIERASKRAKTSEFSDHGSIRQLSFFVEILGTKTLPGSIELVSHLLQVLSSIVQNLSPSEAEVNYTEQLLMSAIESAANGVSEIPNLSPSAIRVDVLVELIRVTENPSTFHQALLLMSNLTRLAPESVLHNVMPVFTFMGSNVFHRDDSYSFGVVQKTIDGIVPVMVSSLKRAFPDPLQLWANSREFLHVFTDAVNHIPRHRRFKFFTHLVGVLGTEDFLAPICMLLVEKVANRVVRQSGQQEAHSPLELPIALLNNASLPVRVQAIVDILDEAQRLVARMLKPDGDFSIFLLPSNNADINASTSLFKRRAQSLVVFVGWTFNAPLSTATTQTAHPERIVQSLVALVTLDLPEAHRDIIQACLTSLNQLLKVLPVHNFIQAVSSMMETDDAPIQVGALDLLSKRLPDVSLASRQEASPIIVQILAKIKLILLRKQPENFVIATSLRALEAVGTTMEPAEQGVLVEFVPVLLAIIENGGHQTEAWGALHPLVKKLGPRIIPYFRIVIQRSVRTLKEGNVEVVYATLQALLGSIPTFWAVPEVLAVLTFYIDGNGFPTTTPMSSLVKALTKRISPKVLLPSILDLWATLQGSSDDRRLAVFFEIVSRTLRSADRPAILESLRALFKLFMDGLSILKPGQEMEANLIIAFRELVVKLNETAFRPLFRRLYDWAFATESADLDHQIVFIRLYIGLQDYFKNLMNPYMSFLLTPFSEILLSYSTGSASDLNLWSATVSSLNRSFTNDDGGFWRDDKLRAISTSLIQQVPICCSKQSFVQSRPLLKDTLVALVEGATDDSLVKTINLSILMHTRSDDVQVRLFALSCTEALWQSHGNKLHGFVAETATFIAECGEDENDVVVKESFKLKDAVERVAGKIDGL